MEIDYNSSTDKNSVVCFMRRTLGLKKADLKNLGGVGITFDIPDEMKKDMKAFSSKKGKTTAIKQYKRNSHISMLVGNPVIYLYSRTAVDLNIELNFSGKIDYTYPKLIDNQWNVRVFPMVV